MNIAAVLAAILVFLGNFLTIWYLGRELYRDVDLDRWRELDPDYIQEEWAFRLDNRGLYLAASFIEALGWLLMAFPLFELSWILSNKGQQSTTLHLGIALFAIVAALTEWVSIFLYTGGTAATEYIVKNFNLDNWILNSNDQIGWRVIEVIHISTQGFMIFVSATEYLCLAFIMLFVHISVRRWRQFDSTTFGACWNSLGLFIGLLALLDYTSELLRLEGLKLFGPIAFWYACVNRLVLLPVWLLMLACRLPLATVKLEQPADEPQTESN